MICNYSMKIKYEDTKKIIKIKKVISKLIY